MMPYRNPYSNKYVLQQKMAQIHRNVQAQRNLPGAKPKNSPCTFCNLLSELESFVEDYWWIIAIAIVVLLIIYFVVIK